MAGYVAGQVNRWLRSVAFALCVCAWLLRLALALWLSSAYRRARAWLVPQLRWIRHRASAWTGAAAARWQAIRRAATPTLTRTSRWLAAWLAARMVALHRTLHSVQASLRPAQPGATDDADADEFEISQQNLNQAGAVMPALPLVGGVPSWETPRESPWGRRLSSRARAGRILLIVGALGLALAVVLGGPSALLDSLRAWVGSLMVPAVNAAPRPQLNASFWVGRRVPSTAVFVRGINLAPSAASSALAYACWIDTPRDARAAAPSISLYVTADGARSWQALSAPSSAASACRAVPDAADPQRLLLVLAPMNTGPCTAPTVYDSADRGASWVPVALPDALATACELALHQWQGTIYAWSPGAAAQPGGGAAAQVLVSSDDGQSWQPAFSAAPAQAGVSLVAARTDGALLVLVSTPAGRGIAPTGPQRTLWCRATPHAAWQSLGALPAGTSIAYAADGQRAGSGCAWGTLYAAGYTSNGDATITRLESNDGRGWSALPPLPIPATSTDRPLTGDGNILGVAPGDLLLVDSIYTGPGLGITTGTSSPAHTFWGWDPHAQRWLTDIHIAPANSSIEGFVWDYTQPGTPRLICWVYTLNAGIPAYTGLYRASFAAPAAPSQDSDGQRAPGL